MAFDFKKEDAAKYGREVYRAFRSKGNHRWDTCVFVNDSGVYSAVFRHSFRKKVIEDGKEIRRNVIDDEIVVAAPDAGSFTRAKFPQLADAKELKDSAFFLQLKQSTNKDIGMKHLSAEQYRFYELVSAYPRIAALWDWQNKELHMEAVNQELDVMSSGERVLTRFFACLWYGHGQKNLPPFDIVSEISMLDARERKLIAEWVAEPFWP